MKEPVFEAIVCPWCYGLIEITVDDEVIKCCRCNRKITEEDLEYDSNKEG